VRREVFARPTRETLNPRHGGAAPEVSYPDITFAVDDCEEAFDGLVLRGANSAYLVSLQARVPESA